MDPEDPATVNQASAQVARSRRLIADSRRAIAATRAATEGVRNRLQAFLLRRALDEKLGPAAPVTQPPPPPREHGDGEGGAAR